MLYVETGTFWPIPAAYGQLRKLILYYNLKTRQYIVFIYRDMWCNLFYDKFAGDHHYNNELTKLITIQELNDGSYNCYVGEVALQKYNAKFSEYFKLEECVSKSDLFKLMLFQLYLNEIIW